MNYWTLFILVMVLSAVVQGSLDSKFKKFSRVPLGLSGADVARKMLADNGIKDVTVTCIPGKLTDHYDPRNLTVNLSQAVYEGRSVAAAAVAAHECGHALQHVEGYAPLRLRSALVPVVSFASKTVQWIILLGLILIQLTPTLLWAGIALFALTTLFSFITLPVEINASRRAVQWLDYAHITDYETTPMAQSALRSAAYTYVVAALSSLATLLYYIGIARGRD